MQKEIEIIQNNLKLYGILNINKESKGLVVFAHGSGSSRFSPRNKKVSQKLIDNNMSTLLFDLLTEEEEKIDIYTAEYRFDISLLATRLVLVTNWIEKQKPLKSFKIGYFGSSTGAAAALIAAAKKKDSIKAIVSRGGRPDLAYDFLKEVQAPTLLIVGGLDIEVIKLNELALNQLTCEKKLSIVEGATHLFEEKNKLEEVCQLAIDWFSEHFK